MNKKIIYSTIFVAVLVCMAGLEKLHALDSEKSYKKKLTFVYTRPQNHIITQWLILIYTDAFERMGYEFVFEETPPKRATVYSDNGQVDGELGRIYSYSENHPNLIRVEEHHSIVTFVAFMSDPNLTLSGWDSLKDRPFIVVYRRGIKKCEIQLPRVVPWNRLYEIDSGAQGIRLLQDRKVDVYVDVEDYLSKQLSSETFNPIIHKRTVHKVGVMEHTSGHAFLHKKHHALVPVLSGILKKMKREGLFEKYRAQAGLLPIDIKW